MRTLFVTNQRHTRLQICPASLTKVPLYCDAVLLAFPASVHRVGLKPGGGFCWLALHPVPSAGWGGSHCKYKEGLGPKLNIPLCQGKSMTPVQQADKTRTVPGEALGGWQLGGGPLVLCNVYRYAFIFQFKLGLTCNGTYTRCKQHACLE